MKTHTVQLIIFAASGAISVAFLYWVAGLVL